MSQKIVKNPVVRLLSTSAVIVGSTVYGAATGDVAISSSLIIKNVLEVLNTVAPEIFGGAFEQQFVYSEQRNEILQNGDLSRAVGKAVFLLILAESTKDGYKMGKEILRTLGKSKSEAWEDFVIAEFNKEDQDERLYVELQEVLPGQLTRYFAEKETELENVKSLTPEIWAEIVKRLFLSQTYRLHKEDCEKLGNVFYNKFANALRKVLINDFSTDGKAFASLQLRIVGEVLAYIKETHALSQRILDVVLRIDEKIDSVLKDFSAKKEIAGENYWNRQQDSLNDLVIGQLTQITITGEIRDENKKQTALQEKLVELVEKLIEERDSAKESKHPAPKKLGAFPKLNDYFTGRETVLEALKEQLERIHKASLFGLHGLGKTQTVLKFAEENKANYAHIIFINAAKDFFLNSMAQFAETFNLPWQSFGVQGREISDDEKKCYAVKSFLENDAVWSRENHRFLLIFDNVDEPEQIKPFVPAHDLGDILFTSISPFIRNRAPRVEIPSMEKDDAKLLLYRRGKGEMSLELKDIPAEKLGVLEEIAENLAYLPVLIENAAVTINEIQISFEKYLERLKDSPTIALEKEHDEVDYQFKNAKNGFSISFALMTAPKSENDEEKAVAETVKEVLFACSVLASANIPEILLREYIKNLENHLSEMVENDDFWDKVRARLIRFDLLEYDGENESFFMHRFVQYVIWNYLIDKTSENNKQIEVFEKMIVVINQLFEYAKHETKENCEIFAPHAITLIEKTEEVEISNRKRALLYVKIGMNLRENVKYTDSIEYFKKAISYYKSISVDGQKSLVFCFNELALVFNLQGKFHDAIDLYKEALLIEEKISGKEQHNYSTGLNNLAGVYHSLGRYDEAIELYKRALLIDEKAIGKEHPSYAIHLSNLAGVYKEKGKYNEAIELYKEALLIGENTIGKKHPNYATRLNNLALTYHLQGKDDEAIELYKEALLIDENTIGKEHPDYASRLNNLALTYHSQGKYNEAIELYRKALLIDEKTIGKEHPNYSVRLNNLASVYDSLDICDVAINLLKEALLIDEKTIGKEHPNYALRLNNLAKVYNSQGKYYEALPIYEEALRIFIKLLGENHPSTQTVKRNLEYCRGLMEKK